MSTDSTISRPSIDGTSRLTIAAPISDMQVSG